MRSVMSGVVMIVVTVLASAGTGPVMSLEQTLWEFGEVTQGEPLSLEIRVSNLGDKDLSLKVKPTCGCTVVDYDRLIAPGSSGVIRAEIDTARLSGTISKRVLVESNDPERIAISVTATAEVLPAS